MMCKIPRHIIILGKIFKYVVVSSFGFLYANLVPLKNVVCILAKK